MAGSADRANQRMVDRLIALGALWSPALIAAFRATPRHAFLPRVYLYQRKTGRWREVSLRERGPDELRLIYSDHALITRLSPEARRAAPTPISSSSQPSLMAPMLEDLRPEPGQRVLEIGAGTGYNAALLAHVVGPGRVWSLDVDRQVLAEAWDHLSAYPERQVQLVHADGRGGHAEAAPYDRIMVTAATPDLEPAWLEQLTPGGVLVAPLVLAPGLAFVVTGAKRDGLFEGRLTRPAFFMPLRAEGETGEEPGASPPPASQTVTAPWAGWFDPRRTRTSWLSFVQSLALFGLVRGLRVGYDMSAEGEASFGVCNESATAVCWLGEKQWRVSGEGRELGEQLWRAFLDTGGPRPTEYCLRASPDREPPAEGDGMSFVRTGPRCRQRWELPLRRQRTAF